MGEGQRHPGRAVTLPDLPLPARVSLQLRLGQRILVSAGAGSDRREASVGLGAHLKDGHDFSCERLRATCRIDWHGTGEHPWDFLPPGVCPARYFDPVLQSAVYEAIALEDLGGLAAYTGKALADLPYRVVQFYLAALAARDRLVAERNEAQVKLYQR